MLDIFEMGKPGGAHEYGERLRFESPYACVDPARRHAPDNVPSEYHDDQACAWKMSI